ncbi:phosphatidylinositol n-acetylglucosaminyltransferase [Toxoplasma gondii GT1]|uniref:Phosphatidylinositol n-acetylglucosaminyltransferase n=3 Tax=Toxoplasma gondii TaxID=5811 RepID=S7W1N1_TOXGG|nr:phosphatidylinositol n-acetylglucosaminyltransferase [Toxoplasma gondii GT1]KAF4645203.1 phosphatidylinositol n-acetylglucosaminyltransferase [Toxoplasma gondii]KFG53141.1 phosphatidylinositol n-acetylglucosaminyltransferase [Toxoplasma gondii FOU]
MTCAHPPAALDATDDPRPAGLRRRQKLSEDLLRLSRSRRYSDCPPPGPLLSGGDRLPDEVHPAPARWEKVLWRRQAYPDNYVDDSFLDSLICNANMRAYVYADLCRATAAVTQHISLLVDFTVVYIMLEKKRISVGSLFAVDLALLFFGFVLRLLADEALHKTWRGLWSSFVGMGCLRILAPILRTLTQTFSEDTVVCLSVVSLLVHTALTDYSYIYRNPDKVDESLQRAMSINAALLANVVLASRLSSSTEVFAVLIFGIEIFTISPMARRILWQKYPWAFVHVFTPTLVLSTALLLSLEAPASIVLLFLFSIVFITFVGPYWLISSQKYKHEIKGPWDVAEVPNYA